MDRQSPLDSMESWFEQMTEQFGTGLEPWTQRMGRPRIDMAEEETGYTLVVDLPGFTADDVDVYVTDRTLSIEAERGEQRVAGDANYIQQERSRESLSRRVTLPNDADTEGITASMDEGVLTVTLPRIESLDSGHEIDIE